MTRRSRSGLCALVLAALVAMPAAGPLAEPEDAGDERAAWQERLAETRTMVEEARARAAAADLAVARMRHRRRPRGEARQSLFEEREAARAALTEAERALDETLESARRAGVPPGSLEAPAAPE